MDKGSVKLALSILSAEFGRLEEQGRRSRARGPGSEGSRLGTRGLRGRRNEHPQIKQRGCRRNQGDTIHELTRNNTNKFCAI